jgi:TonB family protein
MNAHRPLLLAALLAFAAVPAFAAFESIRIRSDNDLPRFPPALLVEGITRGHAIVAISVDTEGKLDDLLVLGYSHERLARATTEVMKDWRFVPARLDGQPVRAQLELRLDFTVEGAVITSNITERFIADLFGNAIERRAAYRPCPSNELDRVPAKVAGEAPLYAVQAEKEGVRGSVEVHFYIDEKGDVRMPAVQAGQHPYLLEKAVEAMKSWKFEPPTSRGRPVLVAAAQTFDFGGGK